MSRHCCCTYSASACTSHSLFPSVSVSLSLCPFSPERRTNDHQHKYIENHSHLIIFRAFLLFTVVADAVAAAAVVVTVAISNFFSGSAKLFLFATLHRSHRRVVRCSCAKLDFKSNNNNNVNENIASKVNQRIKTKWMKQKKKKRRRRKLH